MLKGTARYYSDAPDLSPFLTALNDVRQKATREGWCYWHVHAIIVAIDQYAEAATGNREFPQQAPQRWLGALLLGTVGSDIGGRGFLS